MNVETQFPDFPVFPQRTRINFAVVTETEPMLGSVAWDECPRLIWLWQGLVHGPWWHHSQRQPVARQTTSIVRATLSSLRRHMLGMDWTSLPIMMAPGFQIHQTSQPPSWYSVGHCFWNSFHCQVSAAGASDMRFTGLTTYPSPRSAGSHWKVSDSEDMMMGPFWQHTQEG